MKRFSVILESEAVINNSMAVIFFLAIKNVVVHDQNWRCKI